MNILKISLLSAIIAFLGTSCQTEKEDSEATEDFEFYSDESEDAHSIFASQNTYERYANGKIKHAEDFSSVFSPTSLDTLHFPAIDKNMIRGLEQQLIALEKRKSNRHQKVAGLDVSIEKLQQTIELILANADNPQALKRSLAAHQSWGKDKKGHVKFTGYYAPVISVKKKRDGLYQYPIYARPDHIKGSFPTRKEISEGALEGQGCEIAFASNPVDIYYMQLQGSGYIKFADTGEKWLLSYDGSNGKKYRSIETYLARRDDLNIKDLSNDGVKNFLRKNEAIRQEVLNHNPSYAFFKASKSVLKGAGGVPLMEDISIAADPKYLPIGSVVLASIPKYDQKGKIDHHEYRLLLAQDVGGAVNGPGHVDVFSGVGSKGKKKAANHHHYGRMWLLLPQENIPLAMN